MLSVKMPAIFSQEYLELLRNLGLCPVFDGWTGPNGSSIWEAGETTHTLGFLFLSFFKIVAFGVIPSKAQGLILALHSEITPDGVQGIIWDAGDRAQVGYVQGKCPLCYHCGPVNLDFKLILS